jgi:hypothetical protein
MNSINKNMLIAYGGMTFAGSTICGALRLGWIPEFLRTLLGSWLLFSQYSQK